MILANRKISGRTPHARGRRQEMQGIPMVLQWPLRDPGGSEGHHQLTRYSRHVQDVWFSQGKLRFEPNSKICFFFGRPECSEMQGLPLFWSKLGGCFFFWPDVS